jgi:hypothetical protein
MARLDRAICSTIMLMPTARSSRAKTNVEPGHDE